MPEFDVAIVGTGLLGSALAAEGKAQGLRVVCVGPDLPSASLSAGAFFRLNTWSRVGKRDGSTVDGDQHPMLSAALRRRDRSRFPPASALADAALEVLRTSRVERRRALVTDITATGKGVRLQMGRGRLEAKAAVLALGWGAPKIELAAPGPVHQALRRGASAFDFSAALTLLGRRQLRHQTLAVVGGGPSALSFLEACVGLSPGAGVGLLGSQRVLWFDGKATPPAQSGVRRMFEARYAPLFHALQSSSAVQRFSRRVRSARVVAGRWELVDAHGLPHHVDALVWCGGVRPPLELLEGHSRTLRPLLQGGVKLALQRISAKGPVPVFQVGPALDQLGLADWDTGPFCEWFEKGRRLLRFLGGA